MRNVLASAVGSALGVLLLGALVLGGILIYTVLEDYGAEGHSDPLLIDNPPELRVSQHTQVEGADWFSVQGIVENVGPSRWGYVTIELQIKSQDVLVAGCDTSLFDLSPGNRLPFLVTCEKTASRLPFEAKYDVRVAQARRRDR